MVKELSDYYQVIRAIAASENLMNQPVLRNIYLAGYFDYNVKQGGFAQLLFNLKGENLEDVESMLKEVNAITALEFYKKALQKCLQNVTEYQRFLSSNYVEANDTKDSLHLISLDYFKNSIEFSDEIKNYLSENYDVLQSAVER